MIINFFKSEKSTEIIQNNETYNIILQMCAFIYIELNRKSYLKSFKLDE